MNILYSGNYDEDDDDGTADGDTFREISSSESHLTIDIHKQITCCFTRWFFYVGLLHLYFP